MKDQSIESWSSKRTRNSKKKIKDPRKKEKIFLNKF